MRATSCSFAISSEKMATGMLRLEAAFCATFSTNAVFPIDGRAAMMTSSEGWKPNVSLSRSAKPLGTPVTSLVPRGELLDALHAAPEEFLDPVEALAAMLLADLEDPLLGVVEQLARRAPPVEGLRA